MSIVITKQPTEWMFFGNPIQLEMQGNSYQGDTDIPVNISISVILYSSKTIKLRQQNFNFRVDPVAVPSRILVEGVWTDFLYYNYATDIADYVRCFENDETSDLKKGGMVEYTVTIAQLDFTFTGYGLSGGFAKSVFTPAKFAAKFLSVLSNFLFTTRSNSDVLTYYRSEFVHLPFIAQLGHLYSLTTEDGTILQFINGDNKIREFYIDESETVESTLYVCVDGAAIVQINVLPDPISEQNHILEFYNSYGFIERLLLSGECRETPDIEKGETYTRTINGSFRNLNNRGMLHEKVVLPTGYRSTDQLLFIRDLLVSDEVYYTLNNERRRCKVECGDYENALRQVTPEGVTLTIDLLDDDNYVNPRGTITDGEYLQTEDAEPLLFENNNFIKL